MIEKYTFEKFWSEVVQLKMKRYDRYHYKVIARATWEMAYLTGKNIGYDEGYKAGILAITARQGMFRSRLQILAIKIGNFLRKI